MLARLGVLLAALAAGCGDGVDLPACGYDPALDAIDPSSGECVAARALLECTLSDGNFAGCISDSLDSCGDPQVDPEIVSCADQCADDEYAVACSGPTMQDPAPQPPGECQSAGVTPGGTAYYCCPCL